MNFTQFVRDYLATHPNLGLTFHQAMKDERVKCAFHEEKVRRCNEGIRDPPEPPRQPRQRRNRQEGDVIVNVNCGGTQPQTAQGRVPGVGPRGGPGGMPPPPPPGGLGPPGNLLPPFPVQPQPQPQPQRQPQRQEPVRQGDDPVYMGRSTPADRADFVDLTNEIDQTQDLINYYNQEPQVEEPENGQRRREAPLYPRDLDQTRSLEQLALPYDQQYNIQQRFDNLGQIPSQQQLLLPYDPQYSLQQRLNNVDQIPSQSLQERFQNLQIPQQYPYMPFDLPTVPSQTYTTTPLLDAPSAYQPQPVSTEELFKSIHGLPDVPDKSSLLDSENNNELLKLAMQRANELSKKVEELEEQVQNAVTPEQQEHARRDYENQITQLRQESQRVQEDYRRQLAESQRQLQQGVAESDAAIDGMRRRYNELAEANNAQYQQRLRTLQQLQQQMQYEDEQGKQRLQQQIQDHEQKMQGELATARAYSEAMTKHAINLLETKNHIQNQLDLHQYAGDYRGPSVTIGEDGIPRYDEGGFSNIQFFESPNRVRELPEQREMGTQMEPEPEPEPMQIDDDAIYPYTRNPMRPGYVRNEVRRIDDGRRPPPPQQPRLFGLAPSPISGQPTFQPSRADISYEDSASRVDAQPRADTPPRGVRRQREPDMNPVDIAADRIQTIMETGERGPERDAALTRSIYGLERNELNQLRAQLRARGLYDNVTIRNGKIYGNGLKKKTKK